MTASRRDGTQLFLVTLCGAASFAAWAVWRGQDANWDLQNYHRYAAYALLHWRYPLDVGPAGFQAYLNPLPYLIPYALDRFLPGPGGAALLAMVQSLVVPLAWAVSGALPGGQNLLVRACATLAGVTSATVLAEVGTSFADLLLAPMVLGAALGLLRAEGDGARRWLILSGALIGAAAGLKLTNALYGPGLLLACMVSRRGWQAGLHDAAVTLAAMLAGAAATGGAWAAYLWISLGNPVFPAFNTLFRSASASIADFKDTRFLPLGWLDAGLYPFRIALGQHPTAELPFRDARFAVLLLLSLLLPLLWPRRGLDRAWLFVAASYAAWLGMFSIQRYAAGLEVLAGLLAVHIAALCWPSRNPAWAALAVTALLLAATAPGDFWHRPWADAYRPVPPPGLGQPAAVVITSHPNGYWAPELPAASRFYSLAPNGIATGGVLQARIAAGLAAPPGDRLWTLGADVPMTTEVRAALGAHGLVPGAPCARAASLWWVDTIFCPLHRTPPRPLAVAELSSEGAGFTNRDSGWIYEGAGWVNAGVGGTATIGPDAHLIFASLPANMPLAVTLILAGQPSRPGPVFEVNGQQATARSERLPDGWTRFTLCLRPETMPAGVVNLTLTAPDAAPLGLVIRSLAAHPPAPGECGPP